MMLVPCDVRNTINSPLLQRTREKRAKDTNSQCTEEAQKAQKDMKIHYLLSKIIKGLQAITTMRSYSFIYQVKNDFKKLYALLVRM